MSWISGIMILFFLLQAVVIRYRLRAYDRLDSSDTLPHPSPEYRLLSAPGVVFDSDLFSAAVSLMQKHKLDVLELIPAYLSCRALLLFAVIVDPIRLRSDIFSKGRTLFHATMVSDDVFRRARVREEELAAPRSYDFLAIRLRRFAVHSSGYAVAPQIHVDRKKAFVIEKELFSSYTAPFSFVFAFLQFVFLIIMIAAAAVNPLWGLSAIAVYHIQPVFAIAGSRFSPFDLWKYSFLRLPIELFSLPALMRQISTGKEEVARMKEKREIYRALISEGTDPFFEPAQKICPLCHSENIVRIIRVPDLLQGKPGIFTLDRCGKCGHIFQNPRLSLRGLEYYYKDFYEGIGEESINYLFGYVSKLYISRARALCGIHTPVRWLDIGAGLGHFCAVAKSIWPDTVFEGLDMNESIEEAERARWLDRAICGQFPELSGSLKGRYDIVSMYQYLEHTRDPRVDLNAANKVLCDGGYLAVEIPNPECPMARILGKYWHPWFQPQHQHFFTLSNLDKLLKEAGFTIVNYDYVSPHQAVDLGWTAYFLLFRLGNPTYRLPWGPEPKWYRILRTWLVYCLGFWTVPAAFMMDASIASFLRKPRRSNNYRVLARKTSSYE